MENPRGGKYAVNEPRICGQDILSSGPGRVVLAELATGLTKRSAEHFQRLIGCRNLSLEAALVQQSFAGHPSHQLIGSRFGCRNLSQNFDTVVGNSHRVLPLRAETVVSSDNGPAVRKQAGIRAARIDHWFNRKCHAGGQFDSGSRASVMQDLRIFMKSATNPVTAVFAHHRKAVAFCVSLNDITDISESGFPGVLNRYLSSWLHSR